MTKHTRRFAGGTSWRSGSPSIGALWMSLPRASRANTAFGALLSAAPHPHHDDHRCRVSLARWRDRVGGLVFEIEANRFLHHMVRFLVGTMLDVATGRRPADDVARLLNAETNEDASPPSAAHALFLDDVVYPPELFLQPPRTVV